MLRVDVCVTGATGAGVFAAVAAAREGYSVVVIERTRKIGGLLETGFRMQQDVPEPWHLGGLTGDFYGKDAAIDPGSLRHYKGAALHNVMTQRDIHLQALAPTPVGMGYYKIDNYLTRLAVNGEGVLVHEGDLFLLASPGPYQIPYGAIVPRREEAKNLLVPLMMSASHLAHSVHGNRLRGGNPD